MTSITRNDIRRARKYTNFISTYRELLVSDRHHNLKRHCIYFPDTLYLNPDQKVYSFGDVHADFEYTWYSLRTANLINDQSQWIGGNSVVVQLGDMLDGTREVSLSVNPIIAPNYSYGIPPPDNRESEEKIVNFLKNLHLEAMQFGGAVITCLGNHDLLRLFSIYDMNGNLKPTVATRGVPNQTDYYITTNLNPDWNLINTRDVRIMQNYMSDSNRDNFERNSSLQIGYHRRLLSYCASKLIFKIEYLTDQPTSTPSGNGLLFCHGGLNYEWLDQMISLFNTEFSQINHLYQIPPDQLLPNRIDNGDELIFLINHTFAYFLKYYHKIRVDDSNQIFDQFILKFSSLLMAHDSPLYYRPLNLLYQQIPPNRLVCQNLTSVFNLFGLNTDQSIMLVGHDGPTERSLVNLGLIQPDKIRCELPGEGRFIMTDSLGSRAFYLGDAFPKKPRIFELTYDHNTILVNAIYHPTIQIDFDPNEIGQNYYYDPIDPSDKTDFPYFEFIDVN